MLAAKTLVGLACLIANKGALDTTAVEAQLTEVEQAQVATVIASGACLPEAAENLIQDTNRKINSGELIEMLSEVMPTRETS